MDKSKKRWLIVLGVVLLVGLILLALVLGWFSRRGKAFDSRPLVLIHTPGDDEKFQVGDGILIHATAREDQGLARIELWANGSLVEIQDADEPSPTNLVLTSSWVPTYSGQQQLVVKAISVDGIAGQSSIAVWAVEGGEDGTGVYTAEEGDSLESIAEDHGTSTEELSDLNPGLDPEGIVSGDEVVVPDDEPAQEEGAGTGEEGEEPPFAGVTPLLDIMWVFDLLGQEEEGNVNLRLEIPQLRTWASYDGLHCYVSLADSIPQWYPDHDRNQATDESFGALAHGWWNTEDTLVGGSAPIINWPADLPLPLSVACVGVAGGGTEAVELGQIDLEIPPEQWDGNQHDWESDGEGGHLYFTTRVTRMSGTPGYTPKSPDPNMPVPYNVRLNEEEGTLEWDFDPDEEDPIDGFQILLNGNLQWTESLDVRSSRLPHEWFNPPCATVYIFEVYAFIIEFPEGRESDPGSVELVQPREGCVKQVEVTFLSLETFDLGGDGRYEDRHGDVGPAYGAFYANDQRVEFDHGHEARGLDMPNGLSHNSTYDLDVASRDIGWHFNGSNSIITEVPTGGTIRVGFIINDRDTGRCRDSDDRGCDDLICSGLHGPIRDQYGQMDGVHTEMITSDNGRCRVTFEYRLTEDSPTGERGTWGEPLPWLNVTLLDVYSNPDETIVVIENTGTGEWAGRDLTLELQTREGDSIQHTIFEETVISVGETREFHIPRTTPEPLIDVCVVVDPFDEVLEYYERSGALIHNPVCTKLPDLAIQDVYFTDFSDPVIRVVVENTGDGPVANWPVEFDIMYPNGDPLIDRYSFPDFSLASGSTHTFNIPVASTIRPAMINGYSVIVNPEDAFPEISYENNGYSIGEGTELSMSWYGIDAPYGLRDIVEFHVDFYIHQGRIRTEHVVNWDVTQDIDWGSCFRPDYCVLQFNPRDGIEFFERYIEIYGDETLELVVQVRHPGSLWSDFSTTEFYQAPTWQAGGYNPIRNCAFWPMREDIGVHGFAFYYSSGNRSTTRVDICRENYGE